MKAQPSPRAGALRYLYVLTTLLCTGMVFWILVFPSNWLVGRSKTHDDILIPMLDPPFTIHKEAFTKYESHPIVQLTHILPGALWNGLVPFQLHPTFRKSNPHLHRLFGYAFFGASLLIAIGLGIIMQRGLHFEEHTFKDLISPQEFTSEIPTIALGLYFLGTFVWALRCAMLRRFKSHQEWVIRHISAGIWVAIQRLLLLTIYAWIYPPPVSRQIQKRVFGHASYLGSAISMAVAEYAIFLLKQQQQQMQLQNKQRVQ